MGTKEEKKVEPKTRVRIPPTQYKLQDLAEMSQLSYRTILNKIHRGELEAYDYGTPHRSDFRVSKEQWRAYQESIKTTNHRKRGF